MAIPNELVDPISEQAPCGENLEYDNRFLAMEQAAEGTPEQVMGDEVLPGEEPDWRRVKELTGALLLETRDLRVAVYRLRALAQLEGFAGVAEGLELILTYLDRYWDSLHPQLDPEDGYDPTFRLNVLEVLDDVTFLRTLRAIPLVEAKGVGRFGMADIENAEAGDGEISRDLIAAAFREANGEVVASVQRWIRDCGDRLDAIRHLLMDKVGPDRAPRFERAAGLFQQLFETCEQYRPTDSESGLGVPERVVEAGASGPVAGTRSFSNREEIARTLDQMCEYFQRHEPTSPVPLLLQRAKRLMTMNFMELVEELANDGSHQAANILGVVRED